MATYNHILQGSTTYVEDINAFMDALTTDVTNLQSGVSGSAPVWRTIPTQNWVTGQTIDTLSLSNYIINLADSPVTFNLLSGSLPPALTYDAAGDITGTISALQGGTYEAVFTATNEFGSGTNTLPSLIVSLEVTAPVWSTTNPVADYPDQEVGGAFLLDLRDHIDSDGDPVNVLTMTFEYASSIPEPLAITFGASLNFSSTGTIYGITTQEVALNTITVTATNSAGFSSTHDFDLTVSALDPASETPVINSFESGQYGCPVGGVVPTWSTPSNFSVQIGQDVSIDMLTNFIASDGGLTITAMTSGGGSDALPAGLDITTTMGFVKGIPTTAGDSDLTFIATNSEGDSLESGIFPMNVWDPTGTTPTLDSISGTEGTNTVYAHFSEEVFVEAVDGGTGDPGDATYELGFAWKVNSSARTHTFVGGAGTTRLEYSIDGAVLSGANTISLVYTT